MVRQSTFPRGHVDHRAATDGGSAAHYSHWIRYNTFYGLVFTTMLVTSMLAADQFEWRSTKNFLPVVMRFPASIAFTIQLLAAFYGVIHVAVVCKLINYALRLRFTRASVSLDVLRTWVDLSIPRVDWDLPLRFFFPVLLMVFLSLVPAALWAGAITPIYSKAVTSGPLLIPSYEDVSMIKEYPMVVGQGGPSTLNQKGLFTYSPGQHLIGPLLSAAAGASTEGMRKQVHAKIDNTQFSYKGRSYGVGAPVGLRDETILSTDRVLSYFYQEEGYETDVTCIYNRTSNFVLSGPVNERIYAASGSLPDSVDGPEYSNYIGFDGKAIVAMGVAYSERSPRRYIAIAAGEAYSFLNNTQCELTFTPTLFNVSVDVNELTISVEPHGLVPDFNPQRNLTRTVVRQFELISNDLTNLYVSLLGTALNSSVSSFNMSRITSAKDPLTEEDATLTALTRSIIAMTDSMLVSFASAQLMVAQSASTQTARVYVKALKFGQPAYIYAIFSLNLLIVLAVLSEAIRTRGWRELSRFNYLDPRDLIIAASRGGTRLAETSDEVVSQKRKKIPKHVWLLSDPDEGNGRLVVRMGADVDGHATIKVDDGKRLDGGLGSPVWVSEKSIEAEKERAREAWERRRKKGRLGIFGSTG